MRMKFIYADSLDYIDPFYDFVADRSPPGRRPYWNDVYAHEFFDTPPYHGILVSRAIVGDGPVGGGKYTASQAQRFRREGARAFLRLEDSRFNDMPIFGDCGAFSYHKSEVPPYSPQDMISFYDDAGFTHGCSVDHIIFDFEEQETSGLSGGNSEAKRRYEITLENASLFLKESQYLGNRFTPLGVVQGWSPGSMAEAARRLCAMGYKYLALGGMVPLRTAQIKKCLQAVRDSVTPETSIHILGFAKADEIHEFRSFNITSFDTTSPLLRAFKDAKVNYYFPLSNGKLDYYTAIRVPQALENLQLQRLVKKGDRRPEELLELEQQALKFLRLYDKGDASLDDTLERVLAYNIVTLDVDKIRPLSRLKIEDLKARYSRTLKDRPWKRCGCKVCEQASIEVIIFRASNRNKRRGLHNMAVFKDLVDNLSFKEALDQHEKNDLPGSHRATESAQQGSLFCS